MQSDDDTISLVKKYTSNIFLINRKGYVEPARNFAIKKATKKWVLVLDTDEQLSMGLKRKIQRIILDDSCDIVEIPHKNVIFGKWIQHTGWWPDYHIRLFKKDSIRWSNKIHSVPKKKSDRVLRLKPNQTNAIIHHGIPSISAFVEKINRYTAYEKLDEKAKNISSKTLLSYPLKEFEERFFGSKGYQDGVEGLILSKLMEFYRFVEVAKYWEKHRTSFQLSAEDSQRLVKKYVLSTKSEVAISLSDSTASEVGSANSQPFLNWLPNHGLRSIFAKINRYFSARAIS